jgi:Rieske Fe-S protein
MNERRRFLRVLGGGAMAVGMGCRAAVSRENIGTGGGGGGGSAPGTGGACGGGGASSSGTNDDVCHSAAGVFAMGTPADYAAPGLYRVAEIASNVLIGHDARGLYALSSLCTHECCDLNSTQDGMAIGVLDTNAGVPVMRCLCHGSEYAYDGSLVRGPATLPLAPYQLELGCDGILYADTTVVVSRTRRLVP